MIGGYYGMGSRGAHPSNEPDFGVERDAEFFMDIVLYGVGECGNVFSGGSSEIGEYKWLHGVDSSLSQFFSFSSALFDQPSCGDC